MVCVGLCALQVNKNSIFGGLGQRAKRTAEFILSQGLAHIAASDAHSTYSRNPELARLHEHISLNYSEDYAQILLEENPKRIIENKPIFACVMRGGMLAVVYTFFCTLLVSLLWRPLSPVCALGTVSPRRRCTTLKAAALRGKDLGLERWFAPYPLGAPLRGAVA